MTSCVGEEIIYECTVNAVIHHWRIPSFSIETSLSRSNPSSLKSEGQFNFTFTLDSELSSNSTIITTMSVIAFENLNGSEVICQDGIVGNMTQQNTTVMLFGMYKIDKDFCFRREVRQFCISWRGNTDMIVHWRNIKVEDYSCSIFIVLLYGEVFFFFLGGGGGGGKEFISCCFLGGWGVGGGGEASHMFSVRHYYFFPL